MGVPVVCLIVKTYRQLIIYFNIYPVSLRTGIEAGSKMGPFGAPWRQRFIFFADY